MRGLWMSLVAVALLASTTGCRRLAYWSRAEDNRFDVPASTVRDAARTVANELTIDGASWAVESDAITSMRVVHTTEGHDTILDLRFVADSDQRSSLEVLGYSLAPWSWATFGMTSAWKAPASESKSQRFKDAVTAEVVGG